MTFCAINISVPTLGTDPNYKRIVLNKVPIIITTDDDTDPCKVLKEEYAEGLEYVEEAVRAVVIDEKLWNKAVLETKTVWMDGQYSYDSIKLTDIFDK